MKLAIKYPKKNLLQPLSKWNLSYGHTITSDYELKCTNGTGWLKTWIPVSVTGGKIYTLSIKGNLLIYIRNGVGVGTATIMGGSNRSYTFTAPSDTVTISIECDTSTDIGKSGYEFQLEEGSSVTTFEPYSIQAKSSNVRPPTLTITSDYANKIGNGFKSDFTGKKIWNINSNFNNKVSNSTIENPNIAKRTWTNISTPTLLPPTYLGGLMGEIEQVNYNSLITQNGSSSVSSTNISGAIAQHMFSFDILQILERQFGVAIWKGETNSANKVVIAKKILSNITVYWYGYGTGVGGNKATLARWTTGSGGSWSAYDLSNSITTSGTIAQIGIGSDVSSIETTMDSTTGFIHYLAFSNASDGTTTSSIVSDYIEINLTINSTLENPNLFKRRNNTALGDPTNSGGWLDGNTSQTNNIMTQNGTVDQVSTLNNTQISQHLFSFNILELLERSYDSSIWNGQTTVLGKVAIARNLFTQITCDWYGYGSSVGGNKATLSGYGTTSGTWLTWGTNTSSTSSKITFTLTNMNPSYIRDDGFLYVMANAEASDGVTASAINTDYISITVLTSITHSAENPNVFKSANGVSIFAPDSQYLSELDQTGYNGVKTLDGTYTSKTSGLNIGQYAQHLFGFNIISILENNMGYGVWGGKTLLSDKVSIAKSIITKINYKWSGFGTSATGNGANFSFWYGTGSGYWSQPARTTSGTITTLANYIQNSLSTAIRDDGFVYMVAYADQASATISSIINTDNMSISIDINSPFAKFKQAILQQPSATINSDYINKISGSIVENSNIMKVNWKSTLQTPSQFSVEPVQSNYTQVSSLNGTNYTNTTSNNGEIAQTLFSFNALSILEKQFGIGVWGGKTSISDKVDIAKNLITSITPQFYGFGSGTSGNRATFYMWDGVSTWQGGTLTHTSNTVQLLLYKYDVQSQINRISSDGYYHFLYTSGFSSNGTIPSVINADYVQLILTANSPYLFQKTATKVTKKNLNGNAFEYGTILTGNGQDSPSSTRLRTVGYIPVEGGKTYTTSLFDGASGISILFYDINKNYINFDSNSSSTTRTTVSPSNAKYARLIIWNVGTADVNTKAQIEEGSFATPYEPYAIQNKRSYVDPSVLTITSDFNGKVGNGFTSNYLNKIQGSTVENPNKYMRAVSNTLVAPSTYSVENPQIAYDNSKTLDGNWYSSSTTVANNFAQQLFQFDIISLLERNYDSSIWNGKTLLSDKVAIAKSIVTNVLFDWYGYANGVGGNLAVLKAYLNSSATWFPSDNTYSTTGNTPTKVSIATNSNYIDPNGIVNFVAYANISDGTIVSSVNTDFAQITVTTNINHTIENPNISRTSTGSVMLSPSDLYLNNPTDLVTSIYQGISKLDGNTSPTSSQLSGGIAKQLFSFDILGILERNMGIAIWNGKTLISDKIAIARSIITNVKTDFYGYGTSPTGNKVTVKWWSTGLGMWSTSKVGTHTNGTVTRILLEDTAGLGYIDSSGFMYVIAYADPSNATITSVVNTDYISITLTVNNPLKQI